MSAVHCCLLNVFAAIIHIWWLFIYLATHHAILTGTHLLWNNFVVIHKFPSNNALVQASFRAQLNHTLQQTIRSFWQNSPQATAKRT